METIASTVEVKSATPHDVAKVTEARAGQPTVRLVLEAKDVDPRSSQFQCALQVENTGSQPIQIISIRPLTPQGASVQEVIDTSQSEARIARSNLYRDLSVLLTGYLVNTSDNYRREIASKILDTMKTIASARGIVRIYYSALTNASQNLLRSLTENIRAWTIDIRNPEEARQYYQKFLENPTPGNEVASLVYKGKMDTLLKLEEEMGGANEDSRIADLAPGENFSRTYIYNCDRRILNPKTYTFSFDCCYESMEGMEKKQKHLGSSISAVITPKPLFLNLFAVVSAILGAALKFSLELKTGSQAKASGVASAPQALPSTAPDLGLLSQIGTLVTLPNCGAILAAMITALFFYNIYDSTEVGRKLNIGTGWRSALIIGGLSGLLNERIVEALKGLLG